MLIWEISALASFKKKISSKWRSARFTIFLKNIMYNFKHLERMKKSQEQNLRRLRKTLEEAEQIALKGI